MGGQGLNEQTSLPVHDFHFTHEPRVSLMEATWLKNIYQTLTKLICGIASDGINSIVTHFIIAKNEGSKRIRTYDLKISSMGIWHIQ